MPTYQHGITALKLRLDGIQLAISSNSIVALHTLMVLLAATGSANLLMANHEIVPGQRHLFTYFQSILDGAHCLSQEQTRLFVQSH